MSKTKATEITHYELLYIISNKYSEDEVAPISEKVMAMIKNAGGTITRDEEWGKKRLAYPIKNFIFGYYNLIEFDLVGEKLLQLDRNLRLAAEVLRHQIIKKVARELKKKRVKPTAQLKAEQPEKEVKKDKPKTDLKALDEKLDKILETNDLL